MNPLAKEAREFLLTATFETIAERGVGFLLLNRLADALEQAERRAERAERGEQIIEIDEHGKVSGPSHLMKHSVSEEERERMRQELMKEKTASERLAPLLTHVRALAPLVEEANAYLRNDCEFLKEQEDGSPSDLLPEILLAGLALNVALLKRMTDALEALAKLAEGEA